ncbi:RNA-binding protein 25-like isoform X2 [Littorina saxatilis]|uniref:RNA-binding protein 25 n=1 Tax=Littorina saxatilis TaxID=31220 RepID=A0AAN9GCX1_9CAEN
MSFPPRPPYMPMMSGGFSFAPMGMNMMPMQMMPPVMRPVGISQVPAHQKQPMKKLVPQNIPKESMEEKPPVTTVFVGNISERAPDMMIKQMLQRCGNVLSWKRVQGASGKLQAFGFCEYEWPEATLRCIRLLNDWRIADKKIVVKVDAKTKTLLDEYRKKKKAKELGSNGNQDKSKEAEKDKDADSKENGDKSDKGDKEEGEESASEGGEEVDENSKREDRVAQAGLEAIMREYAFELAKEPPAPKASEKEKESKQATAKKDVKEPRDVGFEDMDLEEDKRDIINREIRMFRDMHKGVEEEEENKERDRRERERMEEMKRRREKERERTREREREREHERERARQRERDMEREREREKSRSRSRSSSRGRSRRRRSPSRDQSRERDRSWDKRKEREIEEEEEAYERRKLEKKLREKEAAYQERLKNWEQRERKKAREYEKEKEREEERKTEEAREARRLKEFLEDYDDLRDDPKFYKGSPLARRLKEREKEKEADTRDRQREKEEIDELKRKLLDQGHPDPEAELARIEREREEHLRPRLQLIEAERAPSEVSDRQVNAKEESSSSEEEKPPPPPKPKHVPAPAPVPVPAPVPPPPPKPIVESAPSLQSVSETNTPFTDDEASRLSAPGQFDEESSQPGFGPPMKEESLKMGFSAIKFGAMNSPSESNSSIGPSPLPPAAPPATVPTIVMGPTNVKRKKLTVGDVFNQDDDDQTEGKKRKLIPLDYDDDRGSGGDDKKPSTAEEKRQKIKGLIESIPTAKDELFNYPLDWSIVDQPLMDKRIKPWVTKKIVEYIGEEEPTLTDFICQKVVAHSTPQSIQNDVAMVLDEEAEVFVVKMWRLLVYETEAKKRGLVK